ncbi:MAG TPA: hypothetical protein PLE19_13630 [Planctomycetota bacterium]|nr:hypothetical protein [Planctomycetota bacterium]HRR80856.1 hypothetical protein [Planctomycetota bacterium]HRT95955.1 hypothetical protein [Planctomycetota bacterium]
MDTIDYLSYSVAPSFEEGSQIAVARDPLRQEYRVCVKEGGTEKEFVASPEQAADLVRFP